MEPELVAMLDELLAWEDAMGGWEAQCWHDARELLDRIRAKGESDDKASLGGEVQG